MTVPVCYLICGFLGAGKTTYSNSNFFKNLHKVSLSTPSNLAICALGRPFAIRSFTLLVFLSVISMLLMVEHTQPIKEQ